MAAFEMKSTNKTMHYRQSSGSDDQQHCSSEPLNFVEENTEEDACWRFLLSSVSVLIAVFTFPVSLIYCLLVVKEYERVVVFRLGRVHRGTKGPGLILVLPCIENHVIVDMRTFTANVPVQKILTKDLVTLAVDAVIYYHIENATLSETAVQQPHESTKLLAQTMLRSTFGRFNYSDLLNNRDSMATYLQKSLDDITDEWGIKIERVDIKQFSLPRELQRSLAAEAEASREANAKVIAAEGEKMASGKLKLAADDLSNPVAMQLRTLQTLTTVSANDNYSITFPLPVDIIYSFFDEFSSTDKSTIATKSEQFDSLQMNEI